jgi:multiple sugar transport system permease protein
VNNRVNKFGLVIIYFFLLVVLAATMFPIFYTVVSSFKTNAELLANPENLFPKNPTIDNYIIAWGSRDFNVRQMLWNSIYYTVSCVVITLLSSSVSAYVFARGKFPGKKIIFAVFSSLMFISLGSITVYPLFDILNAIHLNKSLWGLITIKAFGIPIIAIYLIKSFIATLPKEMDEAAMIDGCSFTGIFFRIIAPLLKPILATVGIIAFQGSWNEYLMPAIFTMANSSQRTLMVGIVALKSSGQAASSWNLMLAGSTVALFPVLIAYAFGNQYFLSGLTAGAVKG